MSNIEHDGVTLTGRTYRNDDNDSTVLFIPKDLAKVLGIENSNVSMSLLYDFGGNKHLVVTKFHKETVID